VSYPLRLSLLFLGMGVDTLIGLILILTTTEPWPAFAAMHRMWGPGPVEDIHWGGAVMWIGGDGLMFVVMLVALFGWLVNPAGANAGPGSWLEGCAAARRQASVTAWPPARRSAPRRTSMRPAPPSTPTTRCSRSWPAAAREVRTVSAQTSKDAIKADRAGARLEPAGDPGRLIAGGAGCSGHGRG
jgi:hypothetical protein